MSDSALQVAKLWAVANVGLAKDALHIYVGLALFLGSAVIARWPLSSWRPLLVVAVAALVGEAWDIRDRVANAIPQDFSGNWHDVWNTMFWPTALMLLARFTVVLRR